jgi:hypothetical protein
MKTFKRALKKRDLFGEPILLQFNQNGSFHNTKVGGAVSILAKSIVLAYLIFLVIRMATHQSD